MKTKQLLKKSKVKPVTKKELDQLKTKKAKVVKITINRATWITQHTLALKFPLSSRLAAWLKLGGLNAEKFEKDYHLEDSGISKAVYAALVNFDLEKGPEADRVPPLLPVYLKVESKTEEELEGHKRPTTEESVAKAAKLRETLLKSGWTSEDIKYAFREVIGDNNQVPRKLKAVATDFGEELDEQEQPKPSMSAVAKAKGPPVPKIEYKREAVKAEPVAVVKAEKVEIVGGPKCGICGVVVTRDTTFQDGKPVHRSCISMSRLPSQLEDGETVSDSRTGHLMRWSATDGKWVRYSAA